VTFGNLKMLRRTGDPGDSVQSQVLGISDHDRHRLAGRAPNFKTDRSVHFGWVQYVKPTPAFPEIRFRFTPPPGQVYGSRQDSNVTAQNAVYDATRGTWPSHTDQAVPTTSPDPRAHLSTVPSFIYARNRAGRNLGYFDDSSDGIVTVTLTLQDGRKLSSFARASAGPPAFAPDSQPVRSMADELEQMTLGPFVADVTVEEVLDVVRRAVETMRLIDTAWWNQNYADNAFDSNVAAYGRVREIHTSLFATLATGLAAPANSNDRQAAYGTLTQIDTVLREYDAVADERRVARQHMPALMRGADGNDLALNRRQRSKLRRALKVFAPTVDPGGSPEVAAMTRMIDTFQAMAGLHARFVEDNRSLADRFADPPAVLDYLRKAVAKGSVATAAGLAGEPLVVPRRSAELRLSAHHLAARASDERADFIVPRPADRQDWATSHPGLDRLFGTRSVTMAINPKNLTAQFAFRAAGNPPSTLPNQAISNFFPGLEFDLRSLWKHIFEGVELHEAGLVDEGHRVLAVTPGSPAKIAGVRAGDRLLSADARAVDTQVVTDAGPGQNRRAMEFFNALAEVAQKPGQTANCTFESTSGADVTVELRVRPIFDGAAFARELLEAGAMTQGLCSPWQADYRECACYYWAASRPDFINVQLDAATGAATGQTWMQKNRAPGVPYSPDNPRDPAQFSYDDLYTKWQQVLKFVVGGKDSE
jgi:hypothetical protein